MPRKRSLAVAIAVAIAMALAAGGVAPAGADPGGSVHARAAAPTARRPLGQDIPTAAGVATPIRLIPHPRELTERAGLSLARGVAIAAGPNADDQFAARELTAALRERGVRVATSGAASSVRIVLSRAGSAAGERALALSRLRLEPAMREQGYVLLAGCPIGSGSETPGANGASCARVDVVGGSAAGVFYGAQTLVQLVEG
ncbi:MAG: glycoside hydrolase family 20 zincin-like fold domain-containing protein, partial [Gemmatimonadaceae bacterium]